MMRVPMVTTATIGDGEMMMMMIIIIIDDTYIAYKVSTGPGRKSSKTPNGGLPSTLIAIGGSNSNSKMLSNLKMLLQLVLHPHG